MLRRVGSLLKSGANGGSISRPPCIALMKGARSMSCWTPMRPLDKRIAKQLDSMALQKQRIRHFCDSSLMNLIFVCQRRLLVIKGLVTRGSLRKATAPTALTLCACRAAKFARALCQGQLRSLSSWMVISIIDLWPFNWTGTQPICGRDQLAHRRKTMAKSISTGQAFQDKVSPRLLPKSQCLNGRPTLTLIFSTTTWISWTVCLNAVLDLQGVQRRRFLHRNFGHWGPREWQLRSNLVLYVNVSDLNSCSSFSRLGHYTVSLKTMSGLRIFSITTHPFFAGSSSFMQDFMLMRKLCVHSCVRQEAVLLRKRSGFCLTMRRPMTSFRLSRHTLGPPTWSTLKRKTLPMLQDEEGQPCETPAQLLGRWIQFFGDMEGGSRVVPGSLRDRTMGPCWSLFCTDKSIWATRVAFSRRPTKVRAPSQIPKRTGVCLWAHILGRRFTAQCGKRKRTCWKPSWLDHSWEASAKCRWLWDCMRPGHTCVQRHSNISLLHFWWWTWWKHFTGYCGRLL